MPMIERQNRIKVKYNEDENLLHLQGERRTKEEDLRGLRARGGQNDDGGLTGGWGMTGIMSAMLM